MDNSQIAKILGRNGGLATSKKYGKEHYRKLAENMNRKKSLKKTSPILPVDITASE